MEQRQTIDPPKSVLQYDFGFGETCARSSKACNQQVAILITVIAAGFHIDPKAVLSAIRCGAQIALSRQAAMYLAQVSLGLTLTEVGRRFDRDRTTVAHACRLIEDLRDEAGFDFALDHLESAAEQLARFCETL